jgi:hypothetical protein
VITRRECAIGLVVSALCVLGFVVFRPNTTTFFADLAQQRAPDGRIEDRRAELSELRRVRTIRFVRSSLRVIDIDQLAPDHFVPAGVELRTKEAAQ